MFSLRMKVLAKAPFRRHWLMSSRDMSEAGSSNKYQLVVVGGGAGGCTMAAKFSRKLGQGKVAIIEPSDTHYYQPLWTLVGGGVKKLATSGRPMKTVLPSAATWIKDRAVEFDPQHNKLTLANGSQISYDFLIVSAGIQLNYGAVKGLPEALSTAEVCSNYHPDYVTKTFPVIQALCDGSERGNAIFTFPNTPVKCAGAPQKIMYLAEDYLRKKGKRSQTEVIYVTSLPAIFGVKKYAEVLTEICKGRDIKVYYRHHLVEVKPQTKEAVFENLEQPGQTLTLPYRMLHVCPPMSPPDVLKKSPLADGVGWVEVSKETLQHKRFPNVFALGDCSSVPTSKTAAAVAAQSRILYHNLNALINKGSLNYKYDGYTSCPLVTSYGKCVLAEFDFDGQPLETLPLDQGKERRLSYVMKKDLMPRLYWNLMLNGRWEGPWWVRKLAHLGFSR